MDIVEPIGVIAPVGEIAPNRIEVSQSWLDFVGSVALEMES